MPSTRGRIVVGVDGTTASAAAVRWAAREGRLRRASVHLLYVHDNDQSGHAPYARAPGASRPAEDNAAGTARLPALARYLRAIERRLDKLADNAGRDAQQMAVVHRVQDAYAQALAALPPAARSGQAAREIFWMIEELRVSLFAQTIGTPVPVSERRIMTAIERLY